VFEIRETPVVIEVDHLDLVRGAQRAEFSPRRLNRGLVSPGGSLRVLPKVLGVSVPR
jgi:hypothetical protein